ncbi:MAG: hypothetical protein HFI40_03745 [Lachnospiraceae bacterium]|nr:hypothetical protein [Lachnospiraceae bacterium]
MKEKIDEFARGKFRYDLPKLLLSEDRLQLRVVAGETVKGSFRIWNSRQEKMKIFLFCEEEEMELSCGTISGTEGDVSYCYHGEYLAAGERQEGAIVLVSNLGERHLPYEVTVIEPEFETSIGSLSDLFQFAGLAQTHWEEAREIFLSGLFADAFLKTPEERLLYRSLKGSTSADHAMEEFLRIIRKKSPVMLRVEKKEQEYHLASRTMRDTVLIHKDGWGLIDGKVTAEGAFLQLEKDRIEQEDFTAGVYELPFILDPEKLESPRSIARIRITTTDQELTVEFPVYGAGRRKLYTNGRKKKEYSHKLLECFLNWRLGRLSGEQYASEGRTLLYALQVVEENPLLELISVHLNLVGKREREAQEQLLRLAREEEQMGGQTQYFYQYLCGQALQGSGSGRIGTPQQKAEEASGRWEGAGELFSVWYIKLFSLLQKRTGGASASDCLKAAKELFLQGCRSPFLYLEAWKALEQEPELLARLEEFEIQVMNWARKQALWKEELSVRYVYLAEGEKLGSRLEYQYLEELYRQKKSREVLNALCSLLLRQNSRGRDFIWYRRGVEAGLKLTGLYEAYVDTFPWESGMDLDTRIYTYFWKDNSLNAQKKAFLYSHIVSHKDQRVSVYENYQDQIQEFARERMAAGQITPQLARVYEDLLEKPEFRKESYEKLPGVMFCCMVTCDTPGMKGVCICHEEERGEEFIPFSNGTAYIDIYTENVGISLKDEEGNRYVISRPYEWKRLMQPGSLLTDCYEAGSRDRRLLLALFSRVSRTTETTPDEKMALYRELLALDRLEPCCRNEVMGELIRYCHEQLEGSLLEGYLEEYDLGHARREERLQVLDMMLLRDMYIPAELAIRKYGYSGLNLRYLQRLCSRKAAETESPDLFLIRLCWYLFRSGKTDSVQMEYLARYYEGGTEHLYQIWAEACRIGLKATALEERLLVQMLFCEHILTDAASVYRSFAGRPGGERGGAIPPQSGKKLVRAFLSYLAYRYLISDQVVHGSLFLDMQNEVFYDDTQLCKAAALKHYSRLLALGKKEQEFAQIQMERMAKQGCILPFFQGFAGKCRIPGAARNKSYIVYISDPGSEVELHYRILDGDRASAYQTERMKDVFFGIHVKDMLLFYGERVQYYITAVKDGQEAVTESAVLELDQAEVGAAIGTQGDEEEACQMLNLMLIAREMGDDATQIELMKQYIRQSYIKKKLFQPL